MIMSPEEYADYLARGTSEYGYPPVTDAVTTQHHRTDTHRAACAALVTAVSPDMPFLPSVAVTRPVLTSDGKRCGPMASACERVNGQWTDVQRPAGASVAAGHIADMITWGIILLVIIAAVPVFLITSS